MTTVNGDCDPAFSAVREVFEDTFLKGDNFGASVAVYADGKPVVDLWGGIADARTDRKWERDTPCVTFSCTKAVTTSAALVLAERELVDLESPVAQWWPEFAVHGKAETTTEDILTHSAGLPAFDRPVSADEAADAAAMAAQLAGQTPEWEPGSAHGYHALTFGWLIAELVRRFAGTAIGDFARSHLDPGLWIGCPPDVILSAARIVNDRRPAEPAHSGDAELHALIQGTFADRSSLLRRGSINPGASYNNPVVLSGGWPSSGLVSTARALARFYDGLVSGTLVREETLRDAIRERVRGYDPVLLMESAFGLGFMRPSPSFLLPAAARNAFGHPGSGGSIGVGDIEAGLSVAFIPNMRRDALAGDQRAYRLVEAAYASLGATA